MTPADKLLTQIKEDREIRAKVGTASTMNLEQHAAWQQYAAWLAWEKHSLNTWERKNRQLEIAVEGIQARLALGCECGNEYLNGVKTPYRCYLHQALEDMEAVK